MTPEEDRYNKFYEYGTVSFYLEDIKLDQEQCRFLILKVLEQAVRDYIALPNAITVHEKERWKTAEAFLFEEGYCIAWGDLELSTEELLNLVDLDIEWVREQTIRKEKYEKATTRRNQPISGNCQVSSSETSTIDD